MLYEIRMIGSRDTSGKSLSAIISEKIRRAIVEAEFEFGESLSEESLAMAFEVSRTPVREALNLLQMQDLVRIVPKSGTYVFEPTHEDIAELCDFRAGLEERAMRLTLAADREKLARLLAGEVAAMRIAVEAGNRRAYGRHDTEFHLAFFRDCGNRYLARAYESILGRVAALRTHLAIEAPGEPARSLADHEEIADLAARDRPDEIAAILEDHILRTKSNYLNALRKRSKEAADPRALRLRRQLSQAGLGQP